MTTTNGCLGFVRSSEMEGVDVPPHAARTAAHSVTSAEILRKRNGRQIQAGAGARKDDRALRIEQVHLFDA